MCLVPWLRAQAGKTVLQYAAVGELSIRSSDRLLSALACHCQAGRAGMYTKRKCNASCSSEREKKRERERNRVLTGHCARQSGLLQVLLLLQAAGCGLGEETEGSWAKAPHWRPCQPRRRRTSTPGTRVPDQGGTYHVVDITWGTYLPSCRTGTGYLACQIPVRASGYRCTLQPWPTWYTVLGSVLVMVHSTAYRLINLLPCSGTHTFLHVAPSPSACARLAYSMYYNRMSSTLQQHVHSSHGPGDQDPEYILH